MKCKDAQEIISRTVGKGGPFAASRAERTAVTKHLQSCNNCSQWIAIEKEKINASLTTAERDFCDATLPLRIAAVGDLFSRDRHDAEV